MDFREVNDVMGEILELLLGKRVLWQVAAILLVADGMMAGWMLGGTLGLQ